MASVLDMLKTLDPELQGAKIDRRRPSTIASSSARRLNSEGASNPPHAEVLVRSASLEARTPVGRCIGRVASFEARAARGHLRMRAKA